MRRLAVLSLLVGLLAIVSPPQVSAESEFISEPVASKAVTSSPQTTGPGGAVSWGLDRIDQRTVVTSNRSYSFQTDGTGVNIYILDSGVAGNHPEFGTRVLNGWSYRSSSTALASYNSAITNPQSGLTACPNDGTHATNPLTFDNPAQPDASDFGRTDNDGHGTHVAGIAAGDSVGVAKNANIIPVRALDSCGNGTRTMILEALAWILADHDANEKAVLNLSVGFGEQVSTVDNAIISLMNEGVLVVAAAGNSSVSACNNTPASTPGTISVGSITINDTESEFSNYGDCVDILAPGGTSTQGGQKIVSAYPYLSGVTNTYANLVGTSMAAPFVTGALARYLQTMATAPTNSTTGNAAGWSWVSSNATQNAITYYNSQRSPQTANRLLYVPPGMPSQVTGLSAIPADGSAMVTWSGNAAGITYTASATPGNATCNSNGGNSCLISGLTNGTTYTITVSGTNSDGTGPAATTTVVPAVPQTVPTVAVSSLNAAVKLSWTAVAAIGTTYVVTSNPPSSGCTTTSTTCAISGLKNGVSYTFSISTTYGFGIQSATPKSITARPGFIVRKTAVKRGSRTVLSSMLTSPSRGKRTWSESGPCSISSGRFVAAKRKTTCLLKLTVAKYGSYPKMTTTLKVTIQ